MERKLKDTILKSGIPLEVSVVDKLSEYGFDDQGEITYEREGKLFSTDIKADREIFHKSGLPFDLVLSIECKFRTPEHDWFFMRFPRESRFGFRHDTGLISFRDYIRRVKENSSDELEGINFGRFVNFLECEEVDKGVEIIKNRDFDHSAIRKCISQSIFGALKAQEEALRYNTDIMAEGLAEQEWQDDIESQFFYGAIGSLTLPIVVTTADLYKMKDGLRLEDVKSSDDPENLFEKVKFVKYKKAEAEEASQFTEKLLSRENLSCYDEMDRIREAYPKEMELSRLPDIRPSSPIYFVDYEHLDEFLENLEETIEDVEG
ncbi:MAG: hypothetical protein ABEJ36_02615 [Candidatus Nanosalina sp.]